MKKTHLKRFIEFIGFGILCLFFLIVTSKVFLPKWITLEDNYQKSIVDGLYEEKTDSLDIIFLGNSDLYNAISPMELWNDYGIASYNYSHPGTRVPINYYSVMHVLETQSPKYIFLGVDDFFDTRNGGRENLTKIMSSMRLSKAKIMASIDRNIQPSIASQISYTFPIIRFHSRYGELTKEDFEYAFNKFVIPTKGFIMTDGVKPCKKNDYMNKKGNIEKISSKNLKYLDKIIDLCNEKNIEIILIETPSTDSWSHEKHNKVSKFAKSKNLKFIDMNYNLSEIGIDWKMDTRDKGDHMNISGAIKVTKFLGNYIDANLEVANHKNDSEFAKWKAEYKEYEKLRGESLERLQKNYRR